MNETIARLSVKVPRKIRTPINTLCHVMAKVRSLTISDISAGFEERLQDLVNDLFCRTFELKLGILCDFPELVEAASTGAFECECLNEQVDHVGSFNEACFESVPFFVFVIKR